VREDLKDPTSWKKRLGYRQRWMVSAFFSGFKRLLMEVVHAKRFVVMVKRDRAEGLGLQPDVGFGGCSIFL
jgi:hypothetical protein